MKLAQPVLYINICTHQIFKLMFWSSHNLTSLFINYPQSGKLFYGFDLKLHHMTESEFCCFNMIVHITRESLLHLGSKHIRANENILLQMPDGTKPLPETTFYQLDVHENKFYENQIKTFFSRTCVCKSLRNFVQIQCIDGYFKYSRQWMLLLAKSI